MAISDYSTDRNTNAGISPGNIRWTNPMQRDHQTINSIRQLMADLATYSLGLPGLTNSVQGTGTPGLDGGHWFIWNSQTGATFDSIPTLRVDRHMSPSIVGGVSGNTYQALKVNGTAGVNNQGFEWTITAELHNKALGTLNSENVAINGTAWVEDNGVGVTGKTWASNFNVTDTTNTTNPVYGRVACELDCFAHKDGGTDTNRQRVGLQISLGSYGGTPTTALHIGRGILIGGQTNVIIDRLMDISSNGTFDIGIDSAAATFTKPVLFMAEGQKIAFDGNGSGVHNRSLHYTTGSLVYTTQNGQVLLVSDAGHLSIGGQIQFPATQVSSTNANTLDDYEEGTWTPALTFDTPGDLSVTYTEQIGQYQKIGKFVRVMFDIVTATFTHTTASGQLRITGLPFAAANITGLEQTGAVEASNITLGSGYTWLNCQAVQNLSTLRLIRSGSAVARATITPTEAVTATNKTLIGSLIYEAAA